MKQWLLWSLPTPDVGYKRSWEIAREFGKLSLGERKGGKLVTKEDPEDKRGQGRRSLVSQEEVVVAAMGVLVLVTLQQSAANHRHPSTTSRLV